MLNKSIIYRNRQPVEEFRTPAKISGNVVQSILMQNKIADKIDKLQKKLVDQREYFKEKIKRMDINNQSQIQKVKKALVQENQDLKTQLNQALSKNKEQGMLIQAYENENPDSKVMKLMKNGSPEKLRRRGTLLIPPMRSSMLSERPIVTRKQEIERNQMIIEDLTSKIMQLQLKIRTYNIDKLKSPKNKSKFNLKLLYLTLDLD